ncbi:2-hydroxy-acid oxidase [Achromobacter sp. Root83]|uniref:alpha-hydroxy acid oxidase n=1 Tax=Achromobacter sp. Root83 TaxID=1736602 RepID=UPI00070D79A9|nr:alpha-hydroxy acid oxidase [Achromobacter sp. Root83]KRC78675.1 2-hydroxy-acid oxidase [Achromobacter sp. Root83]
MDRRLAARPQRPARPSIVSRKLRHVLSLDDFEHAARRHLPKPIFGYIAGAVENGATLRENRGVFDEIGFIPRNVTDVSQRSTALSLFGHEYAAPFGIAPMGISALSAYRGDLVQASAASAANVPMIMSGSSLIRMEEVAARCPDTWFQAYLPGEPARMAALISRVAASGFKTLVVTVDSQILANREHNIRAGFSTPLRPSLRLCWEGVSHPRWLVGTALRTLLRHGMPHFENNYAQRGAPILARNVARDFGGRDHLTWAHVRQVRQQWPGRLIVKGVMCAQDALLARDAGADGIVVSNHGGRQLDTTVSPLRVLPGIVAAVGAMPVMIDSGFRRGTDVLKALALGAAFVFIGRPFNYAAAIAGEPGVRHAIDLLASEVHRNMGMLGLNRLSDISPEKLMRMAGAKPPDMPV